MFHYLDRPFLPDLTVYESPPERNQTGLLAPNGQPIYRVIYPEPIGFVHFAEETEETNS